MGYEPKHFVYDCVDSAADRAVAVCNMTDPHSPQGTQRIPVARRGVVVAVLLLLTAILVFFWGYERSRPHEFSGTVIQSPSAAPAFTLRTDAGPVSLGDFEGKLVLLFFGYSNCPDACPTTLVKVASAVSSLDSADAEEVRLVFVTIDPARDTAEVVGEYVRHFDDRFIGASGTEEEIERVAGLYGIFRRAGEGSVGEGYLIEHVRTLMVIGREGKLREVIPFGTDSASIATDLAYWLRY